MLGALASFAVCGWTKLGFSDLGLWGAVVQVLELGVQGSGSPGPDVVRGSRMSKCDVSVPASFTDAVSTVVRLAQTAALLAEISTGLISKQGPCSGGEKEGG